MCVMKLPILVLVAQSALAATCADLSSLHPPNTAITLAQTVEAGAFTPPAGPGRGPNVFKTLPAFCRVAATLTPSSDSDIKIWLPAENWNGKFQAVGNGGWAGTISYPPWRARSRRNTRRPAPTRGCDAGDFVRNGNAA
jgi:feruloyl esterase